MTKQTLAQIFSACAERCRELDAPLAVRLATFAAELRRLDAPFADVVDRFVTHLSKVGVGGSAPGTGMVMPPFMLTNETGRLVRLAELLKTGPLVIAFHRGHWCPYCRISADALAKIDPAVRRAGGSIVVITPEVEEFARHLQSDAKAGFSVLTDLDNSYALELGLAIMISPEKRDAMIELGRDLPRFQRNASWMLPIPATFVVGTDGRIRDRFVDPDYRKRMDVERILTALEAERRSD